METVVLRGHQAASIAQHLTATIGTLRTTGKYAYDIHFAPWEMFYGKVAMINKFNMYSSLFDKNPLVKLVDTPSDICKPCANLGTEAGIECKVGSLFDECANLKETNRELKLNDKKAILELGFDVGGVVRFSQLFRAIAGGPSVYSRLGYNNLKSFERDLGKTFHPTLVALYTQGAGEAITL